MTDTPTQDFSLHYIPSKSKTDLIYMRDIRNDVWDLSQLEQPLYLYQPTVEPSADGGIIKPDTNLPPSKRYQKQKYVPVDKSKEPKVVNQDWLLVSRNGKRFKGEPDNLGNYAILLHRGDHFEMHEIGSTVRMHHQPRFQTVDSEEAEQMAKTAKKHRHELIKAHTPGVLELTEKQEKERKVAAREEAEDTQNFALAQKGDGDQDDEVDADVDDEKSDDDQGEEDIDDGDLDTSFLDELMLDEEEEEETNEKEKKETEAAPIAPEDLPTNQEIVNNALGLPVIKEEELVRFFIDNGLATFGQLVKRFRDLYKTDEQKEALRNLVKAKCKVERKPAGPGGKEQQYLKLK